MPQEGWKLDPEYSNSGCSITYYFVFGYDASRSWPAGSGRSPGPAKREKVREIAGPASGKGW